jgi:hypothetical protein
VRRDRRLRQAPGGPRAWKKECGDDDATDSADACGLIAPKLAGNGNTGATAGAEVATSWINAQTAQSPSIDPSGLWLGACLLGAVASVPIATADGVETGEG